MRSNFKASVSSRTSVRSLIVACLPAAGLPFVAELPALGAVFNQTAHDGMTVDDNNGASANGPATNGASTNASGSRTNGDQNGMPMSGIRG